MIYLDASCLVKLLRPEPLSREVGGLVARESSVVVSVLSELETRIQLRAGCLGGAYGKPKLRAMEQRLEELRSESPFSFQTLPATVFGAAIRQLGAMGTCQCRTLDRLHLAAMEELGLTRLLTHDRRQSRGAEDLGYEVVMPHRGLD